MNNNLDLSSPWAIYYRKIAALFESDPAIKIFFDEEKNIIKLIVEGEEKAEALSQLLPSEKTFGNVTVKINIIPANKTGTSKISLFQKAFEGNPAFSYIKTVRALYNNSFNYVVFANKVVQYFDDSLNDINGLCSTLYQDIAKDVFGENEGIYFCTDIPKKES